MFLPREKKFFDLYEKLIEKIIQAVGFLEKLDKNYDQITQITQDLNNLEDEADTIVHQIILDLHYDHTRVTEEKGDIRFFIHNLDNIVDAIEKVANRLCIYRIPASPPVLKEFLPFLKEAIFQIKIATNYLRNIGKNDKLLANCIIKINDLENEADQINRRWLARIMTNEYKNTEDSRRVLAMKEVVDQLEYAMDQCEDVANVLETFRLKGQV